MSFLKSITNLDESKLGFIQGSARFIAKLYDPAYVWPTGVEGFINLVDNPVGTLYDAVTPWFEMGFTRTGINIVRNNAEETYDVDQVQGNIASRPTSWDMNVGTQLAEPTFETFQRAWQLGGINLVTKTAPQPNERQMGMGQPTSYQQLSVAVLYQFPNNMIMVFAFRKCQRMPQESGITFQKTGEQITLPVRFAALADPSVPDVNSRFGTIYQQQVA